MYIITLSDKSLKWLPLNWPGVTESHIIVTTSNGKYSIAATTKMYSPCNSLTKILNVLHKMKQKVRKKDLHRYWKEQ